MDQNSYAEHWHLKKEIPIATIITMLSAIGFGTWWITNLRSDIDIHWQAFQIHAAAEQDRTSERRKSNTALLNELKEIRSDIMQIKISLARSGVKR